ncbi:MAG: TRAP transporter substrate-binding protein [Hyphomicrobiaceae bacterium]
MQIARWLAAGITAALLTVPAATPADAQTPQKLRFQASFPSSSYNYTCFQEWADKVKVMSGGKLDVEVAPAGQIVPAFEVLDATHKQVIDGAHSAAAYWVGKNRAAALFGPAPGGPLGFDVQDFMGWLYDGGGIDLYRELYQVTMQRNVEPIPLCWIGSQVLGWFKTPIKTWEDFKGKKCRQTGLTAEVFSRAGMATVNMPGGEILPAAERGAIECAEWALPAEDMKIGFHTVWKHYHMPSTHEPATTLELLINGDTWKKLGPDLKQIVNSAAWDVTFRQQVRLNKLNAEAIKELTTKHGVTIHRTPDEIMKKILETWDQIAAEEVAKNPFFKKVYDSQRAYAELVVPARRAMYPNYDIGANHYWPVKK